MTEITHGAAVKPVRVPDMAPSSPVAASLAAPASPMLPASRLNQEMNLALEAMGATVTPFALYRWELPDDLEPLREAARRLAARDCDLVLFTSSIQLDHLLEVARELGLEVPVRRTLSEDVAIASIGPVMTSALAASGLPADIVPKHPKMWSLVKAAGEEAAAVLAAKRSPVVRE